MGYLVIGRRAGEAILIGDDIRVVVSKIDAEEGKVGIAIDAPPEVSVDREEFRKHKERNPR